MKDDYSRYLESPVQIEKLKSLCDDIFKYGDFDKLPLLTPLVMPIVNIVYFQSIVSLDDRYHAREDLLQDVLLSLFTDMKLRWDKYIHVDNYYEYIKKIAYKIMINLVHSYHNYYNSVEFDPSLHGDSEDLQGYVDTKIVKDSLEISILDRFYSILKHRLSRKNLMRDLSDSIYLNKDEDQYSRVCNMYRGTGLSISTIRFYEGRVRYLYKLVSDSYLKSLYNGGDTLKEYDDIISRICSDEYETLSLLYGDTVLPELYAEFGQDVTLKIVKLFGGSTIKIPDSQDVSDTILGGMVYTLADGDRNNLEKVSKVYGFPVKVLSRIFDKHISDTMRKESYKNK